MSQPIYRRLYLQQQSLRLVMVTAKTGYWPFRSAYHHGLEVSFFVAVQLPPPQVLFVLPSIARVAGDVGRQSLLWYACTGGLGAG